MTNRLTHLTAPPLAALLLAGGLVPPAAQAAHPGADGRVVFVSARDGNLEIYSMAADGGDQVNLTNDPAGDQHRDQDPAVSPDGSKVAYASDWAGHHMDIWVMGADGSSPVNLTGQPDTTDSGEAGIEPTWSPDGSRIAYNYQGDVWVMAADGGAKANLTHDPSLPAAGSQPAWSPDGTTIAYVRGADVWTMNADGSDKTQLTRTTGGLGTEKYPDWSPDGTRIVYERSGAIWRMNADGSGQQAVSSGPGKGGTRPAWSPVGTRIVFSSSGYDAPNGPALFAMRPDGTAVKRLTGSDPNYDPQWQPVASSALRPTYATARASVASRITVRGELFTAHPGQTMTVTLSKRVGTTFQQVGVTRPRLSAFGAYATSFADPGAARCKVVARFPGDADHRPSQKARTFAC